MPAATRKNKTKSLAQDFCRCIKKVRKTVRLRPGQPKTATAKEAAAIAICVKSVLQTRGRTLKRFQCLAEPKLTTQKMKQRGGVLVGTPPGGAPPNIPELPPVQPVLQRVTASQMRLGNENAVAANIPEAIVPVNAPAVNNVPGNRPRNNARVPGNLLTNFGEAITGLFQ